MVYGVAYCPLDRKQELKDLGVDGTLHIILNSVMSSVYLVSIKYIPPPP